MYVVAIEVVVKAIEVVLRAIEVVIKVLEEEEVLNLNHQSLNPRGHHQ